MEMPNLMLYFNKNFLMADGGQFGPTPPKQQHVAGCTGMCNVRIPASNINLQNINNMKQQQNATTAPTFY